jgi:hypothetical protein
LKVVSLFSLNSNQAHKFVSDEDRIDREQTSKEVKEFWDEILVIIKDIILNKFNKTKKKILFYFINNLEISEIASILSTSGDLSEKRDLHTYRNYYSRYWKIIEIIRKELCWSDRFANLVKEKCPDILKSRIVDWIKENRKQYPSTIIICPICKRKFINRVAFVNHLIFVKYKRKKQDDLYEEHLKFIEEQENQIVHEYYEHGEYMESWAKKLIKSKDFYLGIGWVYNICRDLS